jgi:hypothetical protein
VTTPGFSLPAPLFYHTTSFASMRGCRGGADKPCSTQCPPCPYHRDMLSPTQIRSDAMKLAAPCAWIDWTKSAPGCQRCSAERWSCRNQSPRPYTSHQGHTALPTSGDPPPQRPVSSLSTSPTRLPVSRIVKHARLGGAHNLPPAHARGRDRVGLLPQRLRRRPRTFLGSARDTTRISRPAESISAVGGRSRRTAHAGVGV